MSAKEFAKINQLIGKLRDEAEFCLTRISELEKELNGHGSKPSILNRIPNPDRRKAVSRLLNEVNYVSGDTLRIAIEKLETYILNGDHINYKNLMVIPNDLIADAFGFKSGEEVSYESVLGKIPTLFK